MNILSIIFPLFISLAVSESFHDLKLRDRFNEFVQKYNKQYSTADEYNERLKIFAQNLGKIDHHNALKSKTWTKGVNQFTDLTGKLGLRHKLYQKLTYQICNAFNSLNI